MPKETSKDTRFTHTVPALERFHASQPARNAKWNAVESAADIMACEQADKEAADKVRDAFWQDTRAINSRDNCMRIAVQDISEIVTKATGSFKISRRVGKMMANAIAGSANP